MSKPRDHDANPRPSLCRVCGHPLANHSSRVAAYGAYVGRVCSGATVVGSPCFCGERTAAIVAGKIARAIVLAIVFSGATIGCVPHAPHGVRPVVYPLPPAISR